MNGCDPFMFSIPQSYGGVVGVGGSCNHDRLDLTLRLGLPSYDESDFKFNGNTDVAAMAAHISRFGTYHDHYSNISNQCPCPQLGRQGWNAIYEGGLNNPNPYKSGWSQTTSAHYSKSTNDAGPYYGSVGGYHSAYAYDASSSSSSVPPVSNRTLSRRTTHDQDAVSSINVGGSRKKYAIRNQCGERMAAPDEVDRRCTKCNSDDTPMWRKGPLGPKTLCNACGIKYRKDLEKKKVEDMAFAYGGRCQ